MRRRLSTSGGPRIGVVRRRCAPIIVAVAGGILASGCALNRAADRELAGVLARYERENAATAATYGRIEQREAPASPPTEATPPPAPSPSPDEPRSLRDYIVAALRENPGIKAAAEMARAKAERVPQVTALPDPMLMTKTLPEPVRTAEGDNYFVLGVSLKFPVPEKLDQAGRAALQEARMALEDLQQTRLQVIADVKRTFFSLYVIDRTAEIDEANQELLRGLIDAARAQVAAGRRTQDDVLRAQVELSALEGGLIGLRQQRATAAATLNRLLNRPTGAPVPRPDDFELRTVDIRLEKLIDLAAEGNPELRRLKQQIERDRHAVELARLAYWPEFTLGFEWMLMDPRGAFQPLPDPQTGRRPMVSQMSEDGSDNWAITFGFNIPIWAQKIRAGIREARSRLLATQHQQVATRNRVQYQLEDAIARVRAQRELAELFIGTIVPQAQQAFEVSRAAYSSGTGDFLSVMDNWQKWLTFDIQYHRALGELERSVADLEEVLGLSLNEVGASS